MKRRTYVLTALVSATVPVLLATNMPAAQVALALLGCLLVPGLGWARKMHLGDLGDTIALAVVLSICLTIAVATAMAMSGSWSLEWGLAALGGVALAGFVPVRLLFDRVGAAVRLRMAGLADDGGTWADWYRETQEAKVRQAARAAATAREASAVWVDWYADVRRRAAEAREREAAAKQAAVDEWIAWYQQTQLLSPSKGDDPLEPPRGNQP
jgi:hypothetical protein